MKKFLNKQKTPVAICAIAIIAILIVLVVLIVSYSTAKANLGKQQQWASGKDSFDKAYEIAASDKETPDKTLYVPNLTNLIGKTVDEAILSIGQGASAVSSSPAIDIDSGAVLQTVINLNNESANIKAGTPNVVAYTNRSGRIVKASFTCDARLLGYGNFSFVDLVDNVHIIEKTLGESGLNIDVGSVHAPTNRASYTTYASDGTTVVTENSTFSGEKFQNGRYYKWSSNLNFDYSIANAKGDLAETIRLISITIQ